jgi:peptidoglycan/LPS O-acetylase OafA/YrhL
MRLILAFAVGLLLAGGSAAAAPQFAMPNRTAIGTAAPLQLVAGGCGVGFHRENWRDQYGRWHVRCVPNR